MQYKFLLFYIIQGSLCQFRGPPMVQQHQFYLNSYIPGAMQIIAHLTESMKYDLKPTQAGSLTTTTTTTVKPTQAHKPGVFAPSTPPKPILGVKSGEIRTYQEYVERLLNPQYNFDPYKYPLVVNEEQIGRYLNVDNGNVGKLPENLQQLVGQQVGDLLKLTNTIDDDPANIDDDDEETLKFLENYDDSDFSSFLRQQKRQPPTRAYVSLLSIYDLLSKEAKKLGFNKFNGYTENVLNRLIETSTGTAAEQLKFVLQQIIDEQEIKTPQTVKRIKELIIDLNNSNSYISAALRYIPPLPYAL